MFGFARAHKVVTSTVVVAGVGLVIFVLVWFQPQKLVIDKTVSEQLPSATASPTATTTTPSGPVVLATGAFRGLDHRAAGTATLVEVGEKTFVRFEEDFDVQNGPDLVVYLSEHPASGDGETFAEDFVSLGGLKGNRGSQNYEVPQGADLADYQSVVIWCRRFTVGFAVAPLQT